jgi:hypothetical protein
LLVHVRLSDSEPVRQPALQQIMKRTPGLVAIALDEYAGQEIVDGKYVLEEIKPSQQLQDFSKLLSKSY